MNSTRVITHIDTDRAPKPGGHYAQAISDGDVIYISGQLPVELDGKPAPHLSFELQAALALRNLVAIAEAGGSSRDRILKVTAYVVGVEHWPAFNAVYAQVFGNCRPARSVVPVPALHYGCLIELDAVASPG
jgi:2-iminobutanoate/2-iminopropanoate deaminase